MPTWHNLANERNNMKPEIIQQRIYEIKGHRVMLDFDLAELYGIETSALKRAVRRNIERFPDDFMLQFTKTEWHQLIPILDKLPNRIKFSPAPPFAFTVHGVTMLASVLRSEEAVKMNIAIVRAFVALTEFVYNYKVLSDKINELAQTTGNHDKKLNEIYQAVEYLLQLEEKRKEKANDIANRKRIGFDTSAT